MAGKPAKAMVLKRAKMRISLGQAWEPGPICCTMEQ